MAIIKLDTLSKNPLIRLEQYRYARSHVAGLRDRLKDMIKEHEIPFMEFKFELRYSMRVNYKRMSPEHRKLCTELHRLHSKLKKDVWELEQEIWDIELRRGEYAYDEFTWKLFQLEVEAMRPEEAA